MQLSSFTVVARPAFQRHRVIVLLIELAHQTSERLQSANQQTNAQQNHCCGASARVFDLLLNFHVRDWSGVSST
jgi:hypothetical protein